MRISTQVFVRIQGERKVMEFTADGVTRPLEVDIDLDQCGTCGALLPGGGLNGRHEDWHHEQTDRLRELERLREMDEDYRREMEERPT